MFTIALLCFAIAVLLVLRRRRRFPADSPVRADPPLPRPPQPRHVSFSDAPLHRRRASEPPQFLRPPSAPIKSPRRVSPLRLSFSTRRKTSVTSTLLQIDHLQNGTSTPTHTSPPSQRIRFINPFSKFSRSRTLSSPSMTLRSTDTPPSSPPNISSPLPPLAARRNFVGKLKSMFKSTSPQPSPTIQPKLFKSINAKLRRKPAARTQPYGPPWNAPMPVLDFGLTEHFLDNHAHTTSPTPTTSWKRTTSLFEETTMSSAQLSPRKFINEIDEKLLLLQQQRVQHTMPSPHVQEDKHVSVLFS